LGIYNEILGLFNTKRIDRKFKRDRFRIKELDPGSVPSWLIWNMCIYRSVYTNTRMQYLVSIFVSWRRTWWCILMHDWSTSKIYIAPPVYPQSTRLNLKWKDQSLQTLFLIIYIN